MSPARRPLPYAAAAVLFALALTIPWSVQQDGPTLPGPVDRSLRVPLRGALLPDFPAELRPLDRILSVRLPDGTLISPRDRDDLMRRLHVYPLGAPVRLDLTRDGTPLTVEVRLAPAEPLARIATDWPLILLGLSLLGFGLLVLAGSRHPVAMPIFGVSLFAGTAFLASLDPVLPYDPGLLGMGQARERAGFFCLAMLPAAVIHLAMRFPVVSEAFRDPRLARAPYGCFLLPAIAGQAKLADAGVVHFIEVLSVGATYVAAVVLLVSSLAHGRTMTVIERSRALALAVGIGTACAIPILLGVRLDAPTTLRAQLLVGLFAFPASIGWAIVRYRLMEPPAWLSELLLRGITAAAALVTTALALPWAVRVLERGGAWTPSETVLVAVVAIASYQLLQVALHRIARSQVRPQKAFEQLMNDAIRQLERAPDPHTAILTVEALVRRHLGAVAADHVVLEEPETEAPSGLARRGLALWRSLPSPRPTLAVAPSRDEDPAPDEPEVTVLLNPLSGPQVLLVVSARDDALPYSPEQIHMLDALGTVATIVLGSAATTAELERRVAERTHELRDALEDLRHAQSKLVEQEKMASLGQLVAGIAHELNNPLGFIQTNVRTLREYTEKMAATIGSWTLLLRGAAPESAAEVEKTRRDNEIDAVLGDLDDLFDECEEGVTRMTVLVRDLLSFSRPGPDEPSSMNLHTMLDSALTLLRGQLTGVEIDRDYADLPSVSCQAGPLSQVFVNLLANAADAVGESGTIRIRTFRVDDDHVGVDIEDTGCGIAPEEVEHIFEPFFTTKEVGAGTGLGLSISYGIVARHAGTISVESEPGKGTRVRVELPIG